VTGVCGYGKLGVEEDEPQMNADEHGLDCLAKERFQTALISLILLGLVGILSVLFFATGLIDLAAIGG
jgi:hypothetical protein